MNLSNMITSERFNKMKLVLDQRTAYCSVILENLYDPHNISAILRTAEAYGIHNIHIIEELTNFRISDSISMGTDRWLNINRYSSSQSCILNLKQQGYKIYYADTDPTCSSIYDISLSQPFCIVMGKEKEGISDQAINLSDLGFTIPLYGFVESFNVSVAWGIIISNLMRRLRENLPENYFLGDQEKEKILQKWILKNNFNKKIQKEFSK